MTGFNEPADKSHIDTNENTRPENRASAAYNDGLAAVQNKLFIVSAVSRKRGDDRQSAGGGRSCRVRRTGKKKEKKGKRRKKPLCTFFFLLSNEILLCLFNEHVFRGRKCQRSETRSNPIFSKNKPCFLFY